MSRVLEMGAIPLVAANSVRACRGRAWTGIWVMGRRWGHMGVGECASIVETSRSRNNGNRLRSACQGAPYPGYISWPYFLLASAHIRRYDTQTSKQCSSSTIWQCQRTKKSNALYNHTNIHTDKTLGKSATKTHMWLKTSKNENTSHNIMLNKTR